MGQNVAQKLIAAQLVSGDLTTKNEIALLRNDQTLTDGLRRQHPQAALGWLATGVSP
jgi:hypothetical protein